MIGFFKTKIKIKMSTSSWFQKMERDVVKCMFRMNDILITTKYDSLPAGG